MQVNNVDQDLGTSVLRRQWRWLFYLILIGPVVHRNGQGKRFGPCLVVKLRVLCCKFATYMHASLASFATSHSIYTLYIYAIKGYKELCFYKN